LAGRGFIPPVSRGKELEREGILDYRITLRIGKGIRERGSTPLGNTENIP
jgi:hypothetical protein